MTTAKELLDWSEEFKAFSDDGFKAEMVWLAALSNEHDHPAGFQNFTHDEWVAFGDYFFPLRYRKPDLSLVNRVGYELNQLRAIDSLDSLQRNPIDLTGSLNEVTHSILWWAKFGKSKYWKTEAKNKVFEFMQSELSNDDYAKCVLALRCLKDESEYPRIAEILSNPLTVETYHEQLCALISNLLR